MQVLVVGSIQVDAAQRNALLAAIRPHVARTRAEEPGCLDYAFTADTVEPDRVVVLERWADEGSLAAHFSHPNMAAVKSALHANGSGASDILKYRVDLSESVRDKAGTYRADFAAR
jgi:quinol monooxygenase YgiN